LGRATILLILCVGLMMSAVVALAVLMILMAVLALALGGLFLHAALALFTTTLAAALLLPALALWRMLRGMAWLLVLAVWTLFARMGNL
jgi:hypothetical protein